jgi:hypothetical protein
MAAIVAENCNTSNSTEQVLACIPNLQYWSLMLYL